MTKEEAKKLYEGKFFYEVLKIVGDDKKILLSGPFDNIYYVNKEVDDYDKYEFLQVIDGTPVQAFTKDQILVTDRKL